jgi:small subunit ribosomal protein S24e
MELEITDKRENQLLDRTEVRFTVSHPNQPTPRRESVREQLSKELKVPKDTVVIDHMNSHFGVTISEGYAKIYKKKETALEVERKHHLLRNRLIRDEKKKAKDEETPSEGEAPVKDEATPDEKGGEKPEKKDKKKDDKPETPAKDKKDDKKAAKADKPAREEKAKSEEEERPGKDKKEG